MSVLDGFALDADISVSDLRKDDLEERLHKYHRLRVRRHSEVLGVLVEADEWRAIGRHVAHLERELERREEEAVRALILARTPHAKFEQATDETIDDIERQYRALLSE